MQFNGGKINNINKKLIACTLVFTFVTAPLVGCKSDRTEYKLNKQIVSNKFDYESLKEYYFLVIENSTYDVNEYYIVYKTKHYPSHGSSYITYNNAFSDEVVFNTENSEAREILVCDRIEDYLLGTNNIKTSYAKEDIKILLNQLKENFKQNNKKIAISYDFLRRCYFCKIENNQTNEEYYTIAYDINTSNSVEIFDLFEESSFDTEKADIKLLEYVDENFDVVKNEYTYEELREILNMFIENQSAKIKKIVKE